MNKSYTRGTCYFMGVFLFLYHTHSEKFSKITSVKNTKTKKPLTQSFNSEVLPSHIKNGQLPKKSIKEPLLAEETGRTVQAEEVCHRVNSLIFEYRGKDLVCDATSSNVNRILLSLTGFVTIMVLLLNVFALMTKPDVVAQVWHSLFNALVGPVISLSVVYFFDSALGLLKVKNRRPFDTKQHTKSKKCSSANPSEGTQQHKTSEQIHRENYVGHSEVHVQNPIKAAFLKSQMYLVMRSLCFEVFMSHISLVLLRTFSWPSLSNFDRMFINIIMNGDIIASLICGFVLKLFFTKPLENLWKCLETLLVDGNVAGYRQSEMVVKFNQECSSHKHHIDYTSIFAQGTGLESLYEKLFEGNKPRSKAVSKKGDQPSHLSNLSSKPMISSLTEEQDEEEKSTEDTQNSFFKGDEFLRRHVGAQAHSRHVNNLLPGQSVVTTTTQLSDNFQL